MAGVTNFPTALDDDTSLINVTDNVTAVQAAHHNNLKEAVKAIQAKVGVIDTTVATALDYRLGHPTNGHRHNGASGQGRKIDYGDLLNVPGGLGVFETHPSFNNSVRFIATYQGDIYAPAGTIIPTAWEQTLLYMTPEGDSALLGHRYLEFGLNAYNPGGSMYYTKHYFFGGWGMVLPVLATSAIHATYSEAAQMFYDNQANKVMVWTGATWRSVQFE